MISPSAIASTIRIPCSAKVLPAMSGSSRGSPWVFRDNRHSTIWPLVGVEGSSERFKTDIAPMGSNTAKIDELRPVTFRLKTDPHGPIQYGLIAEEVAKVYPELVTHDAQGKIDGVRYEELAPILLNEVQKQAAEIRDLKKLVVEMQAGLMKLEAKDELVARR